MVHDCICIYIYICVWQIRAVAVRQTVILFFIVSLFIFLSVRGTHTRSCEYMHMAKKERSLRHTQYAVTTLGQNIDNFQIDIFSTYRINYIATSIHYCLIIDEECFELI